MTLFSGRILLVWDSQIIFKNSQLQDSAKLANFLRTYLNLDLLITEITRTSEGLFKNIVG